MKAAVRAGCYLVVLVVLLSLVALVAVVAPMALAGSLAAAARAGQPAGEHEAAAILQLIVDNMRGPSVHAALTMVVERPDRATRYELEVTSDGQERALLRVTAPAREAGQAFLREGDNLWLYVPRLKRALRLPPSGKTDRFLGSDLAYSDLTGRDAEQDYEPRLATAEQDEVVLELVPKPGAPTPYGRVDLRASRPRYVPVEMVFYDQRGQAVRRVTFEAYAEAEGRRVPTRIAVEDLLRPGHRTVVSYTRYRFGVPIPQECFTLQALEAGCAPASAAGGGGRR